MIGALQEALDRLCEAYRHGSSLVLLFDYDGTLTPIVEHPRLAVFDQEMRRLLAGLADRPRVHAGILSGRALDELKSLIGLPGLYFAGIGGMELELRGTRILHPQADSAADTMNRMAAELESQVATYPGVWVERKGYGLTIHYRQLPDELLDGFQAAVVEVTRLFAAEVHLVQGPRAWEITPDNRWNKGTAVRLILADIAASSDLLFYAGDGANDVEAIEEVAAMGGITLGVGPDAPHAAEYQLPNHDAFRAFLARLDATLGKREPHSARSAKLSVAHGAR